MCMYCQMLRSPSGRRAKFPRRSCMSLFSPLTSGHSKFLTALPGCSVVTLSDLWWLGIQSCSSHWVVGRGSRTFWKCFEKQISVCSHKKVGQKHKKVEQTEFNKMQTVNHEVCFYKVPQISYFSSLQCGTNVLSQYLYSGNVQTRSTSSQWQSPYLVKLLAVLI